MFRPSRIVTPLAVMLLSLACTKAPPSSKAAEPAAVAAKGSPAVKSAPPAATPAAEAPGAEAPGAEPPAPKHRAASLFVAGPTGVRELGLDGRELRVLTPTPGRFPRVLADGSALLFLAGNDVRRVALAGGADSVVAALPERVPGCQGAADVALQGLTVQGNAGFVLENDGAVACLQLQGSDSTVSLVPARLRIDLAKGTLLQAVGLTEPCADAAGVAPCQVAAPAAAAPIAAAGPYHLDRSRLSRREASGAITTVATVGTARDFVEETASPSGQWIVLSGKVEKGHRDLFLLDRKHGGIHPLLEGRWPGGVALGDLAQIGRIRVATHNASAGAAVRWLSNQALIVDQLLVQPGQRITDLGGDVAP